MNGAPFRPALLALLLLIQAPGSFAQDVVVDALFTNAAMLTVDGQSKLLKAGQSFGGVTLVEADARRAVVEVAGKRHELGVSRHISGSYEAPEKREVTIRRNDRLQYRTTAAINGRAVPVLVDTGANVVAINATQADKMGIEYRGGIRVAVETASGRVPAWQVSLDSVDLGGLRVNGVQATVIEGEHPAVVLLGMTFLQHVEMQERDGVLRLSRDW